MVWTLTLMLSVHAACAQAPAAESSDEALRAMEQMAGTIFAGQVTAVRHRVGSNGSTGVVEIDFAVDDAVSGVAGGSYTLREWAGLWPAGDAPFRVGQRFLMLLHAPSAAGLSSPVGGMDGAIPIRGAGPAPIVASGLSGGASVSAAAVGSAAVGAVAESDGRVVDLRWVQTRVVRPVAYRAEPVARPIERPTGIRADAVEAQTANTAEMQSASYEALHPAVAVPSGVASVSSALQSQPYATVLGKLRGWAREDHATR
ncbi:MAG: hypothetical protein ABR910_07805 [Acidobacteriaceae bacterium]|jgi:uncharacterized membrane protein